MRTLFSSFWFGTALFVVLLALSAFFSGSETALFSLSRARVRRLRDMGGRAGRTVARLLRLPRRLLITILVGNLLVNIAMSSMLAVLLTGRFGARGAALAVACTTCVLLVFGEVTPKTLAILRPVGFARFAALPLSFFAVVLAPVRGILRVTTNALLAALRQGHLESEALLTREEFRATLHTGKAQGGIEPDEAEIIHAITSFRTTVAKDIMVPRPDMVCVPDTATLRAAITIGRRARHTRLPVYKGNIDHVWGIVNLKAVLASRATVLCDLPLAELAAAAKSSSRRDMPPLITDAFLVPELRHVDSLLVELHDRGKWIAILLDEYGGTAGMLTRDHILDALLGGLIGDARRNKHIHVRPNGDIIASGRTRLSQLNWECGLHLPEELDDTLAGYVMRQLGALPAPGQTFADERYSLCVLQVKGNRIEAVRIRPLMGVSI